MDAVAGADRLKIAVVVRILAVRLKDVVINILDGKFRSCGGYPQGLEFKHGQGPSGILEQRMIDSDGDLFAGPECSFHEVVFQYLVGHAFTH